MRELLVALKGAILIARGSDRGEQISHYLLPNGKVLEVVTPPRSVAKAA